MPSFGNFCGGLPRPAFAAEDTRRESAAEARPVRVLAVEPGHALMRAIRTDFGAEWAGARYGAIDEALLADLRPGLIVAPLSTAEFDILDLCERLEGLGYAGRLRAVTAALPNPAVVVAEIRGHCLTIDFDLIVLGPPRPLND